MTKSHEDLDWICSLHDDLIEDEKKEQIWLEKHYGHKPDVLSRKLHEMIIKYQMAHEMLDHLHEAAIGAKNMVTIEMPTELA